MPKATTDVRLQRQQIAAPRFRKPEDLVRFMGAVQAQDYLGALWAIGMRLQGDVTEADVEAAIAARRIVRTWPMRGTLHFVAAEDVHWMLALLTPRVVARADPRYRELRLSGLDFIRSGEALARALEGGGAFTRAETYAALEKAGVSTEGQRGIHIVGYLAQKGLLCHGPRRGKQPTFVLLDEWIGAPGNRPPRDEALASLAQRYLASHGPATVHDFAWWSGLLMHEAQAAMAAAGAGPHEPRAPRRRTTAVALLPMWDEYLVAYKDRGHATAHLPTPSRASVFTAVIVIDGTVRGAWKRTLTPKAVRIELDFWLKPSAAERQAAEVAAERYARFLGKAFQLARSRR